ncbi:AIM24 family protein [Natrinema longum]|uniref:AIM24 family protein n=1 Tax=Natrinema longum TaxID=370324 RepID=UPI001CCCD91C|nr:AIM24 family protein [Natrinema longum]MBZ6496823.1 AIM24 family protein [Natrinema longum]
MKRDQFRRSNTPQEEHDGFRKENTRLLAVPVDGTVLIKASSMIAYTGEIAFTGKSSAEGGLTGYLKDAASGEGTPIMEAEGSGHLYVADRGKELQVLELAEGESISINGDDILAFESSIDYEIETIENLSAAAVGGLTNVSLTGPGEIALSTHGEPLVVTPPVTTDPDATVAWSTNLSPSFEVAKKFEIGQTTGEAIQMAFTGSDGFVVVQPHER